MRRARFSGSIGTSVGAGVRWGSGLGLALVAAAVPVAAQCEDATLLAPDGPDSRQFGSTIAATDERLIVGAPRDAEGGDRAGAVYVFGRVADTWQFETKLRASDTDAFDFFGGEVALDGDILVIGSQGDDDQADGAGAAYVFRFDGDTWIEDAKLVAADGAEDDFIGRSVAIDGATIVLGGRNAVYAFRNDGDTWQETQELEPGGGYGGTGVAVAGDRIFVGGEFTQPERVVHVYARNGPTWDLETVLSPTPDDWPDGFGAALAVDDARLVVGAYNDNEDVTGAAYVFEETNGAFVLQQKLFPRDEVRDLHFGSAVAIRGDTIVIGSPWDDAVERSAGSAFVFRFDGITWQDHAKVLASDGADGDGLGAAVACIDDEVLVGASGRDEPEFTAGAVYRFWGPLAEPDCDSDLVADDCAVVAGVASDCNGNGIPDPCDVVEGTSEDCDANGVPDECDIDCNDNDVPDFCDIAERTSEDANANGVPDECEGFGYCQEVQLLSPSGIEREWYGISAALEGDVLLVGATQNDIVYVYGFDGATWIEDTPIEPPGGNRNIAFGTWLAIQDDVAVIGAVFGGTNREGTAYVYRHDGSRWTLEAELAHSIPYGDAYYGRVVTIRDDLILIGARRYDSRTGAAFLFRYTEQEGWVEEAMLTASDGETGDKFGAGVALGDGFAAVGAVWDTNENGDAAGAVYIFREEDGAWVETRRLLDANGHVNAGFGGSISIDGDRLLVSALGVRPVFDARAMIYRFDGADWLEEASLPLSFAESSADVVPGQNALEGDLAVVGFANDLTLGPGAGAAYVFEREGSEWTRRHVVYAAGGQPLDHFGTAVALDGTTALIGAPARQGLGSVRLIDLSQDDCNHNGICDSGDIDEGAADFNHNGIPDSCEDLGDIDGDGDVDMRDLIQLISAWGPCPDCVEDLDANGVVGVADALILIVNWGP